ncbi:MAG: TorF family putative porin, partial [Lysobacterales bacterium]
MKRVTRILTTLAIALAGATAQAEVTGNIGWMSDYIFRGIPLANSSAMLGLDWSQDEDGFYTGVWAGNVDPGAEVDFYGGYT